MRYVIFISLTCSSLQNFFPHIPLQKTTFPKKVFENKVCVLIYSKIFFWFLFHSQNNSVGCHYACTWVIKFFNESYIFFYRISTKYWNINLRQWPTWYTLALFYNTFIIIFYMFRALYVHHQEVEMYWCSIWYRHSEKSEWSRITRI